MSTSPDQSLKRPRIEDKPIEQLVTLELSPEATAMEEGDDDGSSTAMRSMRATDSKSQLESIDSPSSRAPGQDAGGKRKRSGDAELIPSSRSSFLASTAEGLQTPFQASIAQEEVGQSSGRLGSSRPSSPSDSDADQAGQLGVASDDMIQIEQIKKDLERRWRIIIGDEDITESLTSAPNSEMSEIKVNAVIKRLLEVIPPSKRAIVLPLLHQGIGALILEYLTKDLKQGMHIMNHDGSLCICKINTDFTKLYFQASFKEVCDQTKDYSLEYTSSFPFFVEAKMQIGGERPDSFLYEFNFWNEGPPLYLVECKKNYTNASPDTEAETGDGYLLIKDPDKEARKCAIKEILKQIYNPKTTRYIQSEEIRDLMVYLDYKAHKKRQGFEEGSYVLEDEDGRLFKSLLDPSSVYKRISTHKMGDPSNMSEQYGIDFIDPIPPYNKRHILFFQFTGLDGKKKLFIKPENYGTKIGQGGLLHLGELIRSTMHKYISAKSKSPAVWRKERLHTLDDKYKALLAKFNEYIRELHNQNKLDMTGVDQRIEEYGLAYVWLCVQQIYHLQDEPESETFKKIVEELRKIDNIEHRKANEVVFTKDELLEVR